MIDIDSFLFSSEMTKYKGEKEYEFQTRVKNRAVENELEKASWNAREGAFEEAILRLIDIIETLQQTS